jgi:betaine-aldehyde dehydrogenase
LQVLNPCDGELLGVAGAATVEQADRAVTAAAAAFKTWSKLANAEHADWLRKLADELNSRKDRIAAIESLNTGKPFREAQGDVDDAVAAFRYCANMTENRSIQAIQTNTAALPDPSFTGSIRYEPVGVVVGITPFNFPLMMAAWKVGPSLAAGCTIVLKPSEFTPFTTLELAAAAEAVGLPKGVLSVVTGDGKIGNELVTHRLTDKVTFTGSVATGSRVMKACADGVKRVTLELGGKSPAIVFDDADVDAAMEWLIFGCMWNCGQICSATARILLQEGIAQKVTDRLVAAAKGLKQGLPFDADTEIGPNCNKMQWEKVHAYIAKSKAEGLVPLCGGGVPEGELFQKGCWTAPTIFGGVTPKHTIFNEEIFGPVASITTFKTVEEAIELANHSEYGLAAAVFSKNDTTLQRCAEELRAGVVWLNNAQPSPHAQPWGGFKKSGIGREMGPLALLPFLEAKAVTGWTAGAVGWYAGAPSW